MIEISVYGGSALTLSFDWRVSTKDVDAVFEADKTFVRRMAQEIAAENGWDDDWLNDGVKEFLSGHDADLDANRLFGTFPSEAFFCRRAPVAEGDLDCAKSDCIQAADAVRQP